MRGLLLLAILGEVSAVIWHPFIKAYEFTLVKAEAADHAATSMTTASTTASQDVQGEGHP